VIWQEEQVYYSTKMGVSVGNTKAKLQNKLINIKPVTEFPSFKIIDTVKITRHL